MEVLIHSFTEICLQHFLSTVIFYPVILNKSLNTGPPLSNLLQQHIWNPETSLLFRGKSQVSKQVSNVHTCLHAHICRTSSGFSRILVAAETRPCSSQALLSEFRALTLAHTHNGPPQVQAKAETAGTPLTWDHEPLLPLHLLSPRPTLFSLQHMEAWTHRAVSLPASRYSYEKASKEKRACLEIDWGAGRSWIPGWKWRQVVRASWHPGAPRKEGRADRGGLGFSEETQAPSCLSLPQNLLFVGHSPCQCSWLVCSRLSSCSGDCTFLRTNPLLPARPFYWPIAACSRLLRSSVFLGCQL